MTRKDCKSCEYKPDEHDTLEGFCMTCAADRLRQYDQLQAENKKLKNKTYGWCNNCDSLVVGDVEHLCDKCGGFGGKRIFLVESEIVKLKTLLAKALKQ